MIELGKVRADLTAALEAVGLNVSPGADIVPKAASIGPFRVTYHATIAGAQRAGMSIATTSVRVVVSRADEPSAADDLDDALTYVWQIIEAAPGVWHSCRVITGEPVSPLIVGDASYVGAQFEVELYV